MIPISWVYGVKGTYEPALPIFAFEPNCIRGNTTTVSDNSLSLVIGEALTVCEKFEIRTISINSSDVTILYLSQLFLYATNSR